MQAQVRYCFDVRNMAECMPRICQNVLLSVDRPHRNIPDMHSAIILQTSTQSQTYGYTGYTADFEQFNQYSERAKQTSAQYNRNYLPPSLPSSYTSFLKRPPNTALLHRLERAISYSIPLSYGLPTLLLKNCDI